MTEPSEIQSKLSIREATKTVSETELWLHCSGLGRVMGLVFNDLGQETKGISTKRLRYGRINTLYSKQASDEFQHSFRPLRLKLGGGGQVAQAKKSEKLCNFLNLFFSIAIFFEEGEKSFEILTHTCSYKDKRVPSKPLNLRWHQIQPHFKTTLEG